MSVAIAIEIGSPQSHVQLVKRTFDSIKENIGTDDFVFVVALAPYVSQEIHEYLDHFKKTNKNIICLPQKNYFWADFINTAIEQSADYDYFIKAHDDIELITPNFFPKVKSILDNISEPVGWVNFTDKDYLNGHWAPSTRPGFHIDNIFENGWDKHQLFQFHTLPENWLKPPWSINLFYKLWKKISSGNDLNRFEIPLKVRKYYESLPYDFPQSPVKCHAPFNHFVLIKRKALDLIGQCENWQTYNALLVDEDWGLRALQLRFFNIWIPQIEYIHHRLSGGTRSWDQIAHDQIRVHELFYNKWGFHSDPSIEELEFIKQKYQNTNIPWSSERRSYEWDYIY